MHTRVVLRQSSGPAGKIKAVKYVTVPSSLANASDVRVPNLIYASAYKRHQTAELVERAFRPASASTRRRRGQPLQRDRCVARRKRTTTFMCMRFLGVGEALRNAVASMPLLKPSDGFFVQVKVHHVSAPKKGVEAPSAEEAAQGAADRVTRAEDRSFALAHDLLVQAPGLVSGNRPALDRGARCEDRPSHGISPEQATLKFALQLGVVPVVGSTSALHVRDDLAALAAAPFTRAEMDGVEFAYSKGRKPAAPHVKMPRATSTKHEHRA
ncbi:oxidoreductase [Aureococcus anophagefferens]|nr:oxidoreductase [Aureococcus anophagefferens]